MTMRHGARLPALTAIAMLLCVSVATVAHGAGAEASFQTIWLDTHNNARRAVGVSSLVWDDALAARAKVWADALARSGRFEHATQQGDGENLWMGTKGAYAPKDMVQTWIDEKQDYRPGRFPNISRTGNWSDVGHYTQIIWWNTKRVGCAMASNRKEDYLVCRYAAPGNWMGENPEGPPRSRTQSSAKH